MSNAHRKRKRKSPASFITILPVESSSTLLCIRRYLHDVGNAFLTGGAEEQRSIDLIWTLHSQPNETLQVYN